MELHYSRKDSKKQYLSQELNIRKMWTHSMAQFPHLEEINHTFLESGHSQMECDSIHSTIETAKRSTSTYVASQWNTVISMARLGKPYHGAPLKYMDILNTLSRSSAQIWDPQPVGTRWAGWTSAGYKPDATIHTLSTKHLTKPCSRRLKSKQQRERRVDHPCYPVCFPNAIKQDSLSLLQRRQIMLDSARNK